MIGRFSLHVSRLSRGATMARKMISKSIPCNPNKDKVYS
jgi:hypothetical protein